MAAVAALYRIAKLGAFDPLATSARPTQKIEQKLLDLLVSNEASPQGMANTMWALARIKSKNAQLLDVLGEHGVRRASEFRPPDWSSIAWSLATLQ